MRQTTLLFQGSGLENIKIISQEMTGLWGTIRAFLEPKIVPGGFSPAPRLFIIGTSTNLDFKRGDTQRCSGGTRLA